MGLTPASKGNAFMSTEPAPKAYPSVEDVAPAEEGGPIARTGFNYQDEIAVGFLLEMLEDPTVLKVHCETHDDIVVLRRLAASELAAEYVQVKGSEADKFWSVADLCMRIKAKVGSSIFETSLSRDKHRERSQFRIVTLRPLTQELKILSYDRTSSNRKPENAKVVALVQAIDHKCPGAKSAKENGAVFWVENCYWEERQTEKMNGQGNLVRVLKLSEKDDHALLPEQAELILDELRGRAKAAGDAKWASGKGNKIVERDHLREWWESRLQQIKEGSSNASGGKLAGKMASAQLPETMIRLAKELRRDYSSVSRISRYSPAEEDDGLRSRVKAKVQSLQSSLFSGDLDLNGVKFHDLCLKEMDQINKERPKGTPDRSAFLKGCMYDIADRCLLRFERASS
jgi:hypothetical protein